MSDAGTPVSGKTRAWRYVCEDCGWAGLCMPKTNVDGWHVDRKGGRCGGRLAPEATR